MKWISLNDLREKYLSFFESKEHLRLASFPLIPQNDNSLLLINSGMAPMKKYFTGEITPPKKRVTTCQKCIRTPDIERVGKTARHGTYFEMLGNFSFGDYFKNEATAWAWEFCTKVLEMPVDKLWVTIYQDDDEAFEIWTKNVGVDPGRIVRMGKEDNFWEHGSGPCGPCSEIYFDRGEQYGCGSPTCGVGCDCDRYVEFWNLVFTQFNSDGAGNYSPLANPNIDTGMGLERLACIMQGVDNLFEVDTVANIISEAGKVAGIQYKSNPVSDVSLRVIGDHIRSTTFMIGDGVLPSNEGRGYVLRRLLRRAARHGRLLGVSEPFLYRLCETVISANESAYPELKEKADFIKKLIRVEEESFERTIDQGLFLLNQMMDKSTAPVLSGEDAFRLYDTFGFPLDLTKDILEERGMTVDEEAFTTLMNEQRTRARSARKNAGADAWIGENSTLSALPSTSFFGYDHMQGDAQILAIIKDAETVSSAYEGDEIILVLDRTPFYAESGGQTGDTGVVSGGDGRADIQNTTKTHSGVFLHSGVVKKGILSVGDTVNAQVDEPKRLATMRNHTGAHLLQAALRGVLGTHVEQAGQLVDSLRVRFDFTHFSALSVDEISRVEAFVNDCILSGLAVAVREMPIDEAKAMGAMALFGEKYGDVVRVVAAGGQSVELCGGTHIDNTAKIGLFRIVSESSVAAGVRRIEAVTGTHVLELINTYRSMLVRTGDALKTGNIDELAQRAAQVAAELKEKDKEIDSLRSQLAGVKIDSLLENAVSVGPLRLITGSFDNADADALRAMCDRLKENQPAAVAVLAGVSKEKGTVTFSTACGKEAVKAGAHAGNLVREVAKIAEGSGGGRPDSAMAGGKNISKVTDALSAAASLLESMVTK